MEKTYLIRIELNENDNYESFKKEMLTGETYRDWVEEAPPKQLPHTTYLTTSSKTPKEIAEAVETIAKNHMRSPSEDIAIPDLRETDIIPAQPPKIYVVEINQENEAHKNLLEKKEEPKPLGWIGDDSDFLDLK